MSAITSLAKDEHRELVGMLESRDDLERALALFGSSGWHRSELSLLAQDHKLLPEHLHIGTTELADAEEAPRAAPVSSSDVRQVRVLVAGIAGVIGAFLASFLVVVNGGSLLAAAAVAVAVGAGLVGLVDWLGHRFGFARKRFLGEQKAHGGILLWVKVRDRWHEQRARGIFQRLGAANVHVHEGT